MTRPFARAAAAYVCAFPAGAVAARLLLAHAPPGIARDLAQPLPVVTSWGAFGASCFAALSGALVLALAALVGLVRTAPPGALLRPGWVVLGLAAAGLAGAALMPFTFSSDPYAYAAYGETAARGLDPYAAVPAAVHGAAIDAARYQWGGAYPVCVYGPAFVGLARIVWSAAGPYGAGAAVVAFRLLAAAAFLVGIAFLDRALDGLPRRLRFALLCACGLDPVLLWSAAEGHNDALVFAVGAAAAAAFRRGWGMGAAFVLGASAAIKGSAAVLAAGLACDAVFVLRRGRIAGSAVAGVALAAAFALPAMLPAFGAIGRHGSYAPQVSLQALVGPVPAVVIAGAAGSMALRRLLRRNRAGLAWLGLAGIALLPNPYPWYGFWLVPFALAAGPSAASRTLYGVTFLAFVRYLPDAAGNMSPSAVRLAAVIALLPLVVLPISVLVRLLPQKAVASS